MLVCLGPWESIGTNIIGLSEKAKQIWISNKIWNGTLGPSGGFESAQKCEALVAEVQESQ